MGHEIVFNGWGIFSSFFVFRKKINHLNFSLDEICCRYDVVKNEIGRESIQCFMFPSQRYVCVPQKFVFFLNLKTISGFS